MARCEQGQEYRLTITSADELKHIPLEFTNISNGKVMVYRDGKFVMEDQSGTGGNTQAFTDLTDTPSEYNGVGKYVVINPTNDGLEFVDAPQASECQVELLKAVSSIDLEPYKGYNRLIYQVLSNTEQEYTQILPKILETEKSQIIILENKSDYNITIQPNTIGDSIGGGTTVALLANYHMILTPSLTTQNWEVTFLGEKFEGELVKADILNSIKSGDNVTIDRSIDGEIVINSVGGGGTPTDNTILIEKNGIEEGTVKTLDFVGEGINVNIDGDKALIGIVPTDSSVDIPQIHEKYDFQVPLNKNSVVEKFAFNDIMISTVERDSLDNSIILPKGRYGVCTNIKIDSKFQITETTGVTIALYNDATGIPVIGVDGQLINKVFNFDSLPQDLRLKGMFDIAEDNTKVSLRMKVPTLFPVNAFVGQNSGMVISEITNQQGSKALHSFELEHNIVLTMNKKRFVDGIGFNESFGDLDSFGGIVTDYKILGQYTYVSTSNQEGISVVKSSQGIRAYGSPTGSPIVEVINEISGYYTGLLSGKSVKALGQVDNTNDNYTIHILSYIGAKPTKPHTINRFENGEWIYNEGYSLIKTVDVLSGASPIFSTQFTMPECDSVMVVVTQKTLNNPINVFVNAIKITTPSIYDAYNIAIEPFNCEVSDEGGSDGVTEDVVNSIVDTKISEIEIPSVPSNIEIETLAKGVVADAKVSDMSDVPVYDSAEDNSVLTKEGDNLVWKAPVSTGGGSTGGEGLTFTIQKVPLNYIEGTNSFDDTNPYQWKSNMSSKLVAYQSTQQNVLIIKTWSNGVVEYYGTLALKYVNLVNQSSSSKKTSKFQSLNISIKCGLPPSGFTYEGSGDTPLGTIMCSSPPFPSYMTYGNNKLFFSSSNYVLLIIDQTSRVATSVLEGQSEYNEWSFAINFQGLLRPTGVSE